MCKALVCQDVCVSSRSILFSGATPIQLPATDFGWQQLILLASDDYFFLPSPSSSRCPLPLQATWGNLRLRGEVCVCVRSLSAWLALGLALLLCVCVCFLGLGSAKEMFRTVWRLSVSYGVQRSFLGMLLGKVGGGWEAACCCLWARRLNRTAWRL